MNQRTISSLEIFTSTFKKCFIAWKNLSFLGATIVIATQVTWKDGFILSFLLRICLKQKTSAQQEEMFQQMFDFDVKNLLSFLVELVSFNFKSFSIFLMFFKKTRVVGASSSVFKFVLRLDDSFFLGSRASNYNKLCSYKSECIKSSKGWVMSTKRSEGIVVAENLWSWTKCIFRIISSQYV